MKPYRFLLLFLLLGLAACYSQAAPQPAPGRIEAVLPQTWTPQAKTSSSPPPSATERLPLMPYVTPTWGEQMRGVASAFPPGTRVESADIWLVGQDNLWASILAVPYRLADGSGYSFALVGQPRSQKNGPWDGSTHTILWDWSKMGLEPRAWASISRPSVDGTFYASAVGAGTAQAQGWLVFWNYGKAADVLAISPAHHPQDMTARFDQNGGLFIRDGAQLIFYTIENRLAVERWSTGNVPARTFELAWGWNQQDGLPGLDFNGDHQKELVIYWGEWSRALAQIYTYNPGLPPGDFRLIGELPADAQSAEIKDGQFMPAQETSFLAPDPIENPQRWLVYRWNGERLEAQESLPLPGGALVTHVAADEPFPQLPEDLVFQRDNQWYQLPKEGGAPLPLGDRAPTTAQCRSSDLSNCFSPGRRYQISTHGVGIEGGVDAIKDRWSGVSVDIPGTFIYTTGNNTYSWLPDGSAVLLAQGPFGVLLDRVQPSTGERTSLLNISACNPDTSRCWGNLAATDPVVFTDGSYGLAVQSENGAHYPPPGVYRLSQQGNLTRLAALPLLNPDCTHSGGDDWIYGQVSWSTDRSMFLFEGGGVGIQACRGGLILLGRSDGSAAWDLTDALNGGVNFDWGLPER